MNNFVTIKTFTYPIDASIIRGKLESEGIECFIKDELTVQVDNFYSNAIGGVKLQVREKDVEHAVEILKEGGYATDADYSPSDFWVKLDKRTSHLFLLKNVRVEWRLLILASIAISIIVLIIYWVTTKMPGGG
jgi:hypothetical protein